MRMARSTPLVAPPEKARKEVWLCSALHFVFPWIVVVWSCDSTGFHLVPGVLRTRQSSRWPTFLRFYLLQTTRIRFTLLLKVASPFGTINHIQHVVYLCQDFFQTLVGWKDIVQIVERRRPRFARRTRHTRTPAPSTERLINILKSPFPPYALLDYTIL